MTGKGTDHFKVFQALENATRIELSVFEQIENGEFVKDFIKFLETSARTDQGMAVRCYPWLIEYAKLIANFKKSITVTSGAAQIGKSLVHVLLFVYAFARGMNSAFTFATVAVAERQVKSQLNPMLKHALKVNDSDISDLGVYSTRQWRSDKNDNSAYFIGATSSNTSNNGGAGQSAKIQSFPADYTICDEISNTPLDFVEQLAARREASRIKVKPERLIGTPGSGNGAEYYVEQAEYKFEGACHCDACGKVTTLSPIGALVQQVDGHWHDREYKPLLWRYHDENDKVSTAFLGCTHCDAELQFEETETFFYDFNKKMLLADYLAEREDVDEFVAIILTPLFRTSNTASRLLSKWLTSTDKPNFFQQVLGVPFIAVGSGITKDSIVDAIVKPPVRMGKKVRIYGIDQGTSYLYTACFDFYYTSIGMTEDFIQNCIIDVIDISPQTLVSINNHVKSLNPSLVVCDIDPSRYTANKISRECGARTIVVDQRSENQTELFKHVELQEAGVRYNAVAFRDSQIKFDFTSAFNDRRAILPDSFKHFLVGKHAINPITHLCSVTWDATEGVWQRPRNKEDDLFMASMFAMFGFRFYLDNNVENLHAFYAAI
jgi:hypothetical protein